MTYMRARSIDFASVFSGVRVTRSLLLCVCFVDRFCHFVRFLLVNVLSVIRYTDSDYLPLVFSSSSYICIFVGDPIIKRIKLGHTFERKKTN